MRRCRACATMRSATSRWNIRVSERHHGGHGRRRASAAAARCRHCRAGWRRHARRRRPRRSRRSCSASPSIRRSWPGNSACSSASAGRQRRSRSTATTFAPASSRARVSPPGPGPDLVDGLPVERAGDGGDPGEQLAVEDEILAERLARLQPVAGDDVAQRLGRVRHQAARGAVDARIARGHADRGGHRARIGAVLPGDVERRAMIGRGADDRQAERDVDAFVEMQRLQRDQRLVVIHAQGRVVVGARALAWNMVSAGWGPVTCQPSARSASIAGSIISISSRPERAAFAGMRD